jgi:N-acetylglucosamine malate deacetylase 1
MTMNLNGFSRILVLAPHTDDGEIGAGATINRLMQLGADCRYIAFSACEESVPKEFPRDILRKEVLNATSQIGIASEKVKTLDYRVRRFNERRQDILEEMIAVRKEFAPDLVMMPSLNDVHQDHGVIAQEGQRAFKNTTLFCYELPWNSFGYNPNCYVALTEESLAAKVSAITQYKSQGFRHYTSEQAVRATAIYPGLSTNSKLAEAFEVIRWHIQ